MAKPICLRVAYDCFHTAMAELNSGRRDCVAHEAENI